MMSLVTDALKVTFLTAIVATVAGVGMVITKVLELVLGMVPQRAPHRA